ncbi:hypothetical protein QBC41DRAFT_338871 [Cercophora samala]|uniref:Uncharacterized protein n=1 Tax=Cercophora samala TaxID=330535 RepID=A0AA39Z9E0_9PEZI|nr:hypothetical protein QBC41DRAFT_338871 [Cercophora samala]
MAEQMDSTGIIVVVVSVAVIILLAAGFALCHDHAWGLRRCLRLRPHNHHQPRTWTGQGRILEMSKHSRLSTLHLPFPAQATFNKHHGLRRYGDRQISDYKVSSRVVPDIENQLQVPRPVRHSFQIQRPTRHYPTRLVSSSSAPIVTSSSKPSFPPASHMAAFP